MKKPRQKRVTLARRIAAEKHLLIKCCLAGSGRHPMEGFGDSALSLARRWRRWRLNPTDPSPEGEDLRDMLLKSAHLFIRRVIEENAPAELERLATFMRQADRGELDPQPDKLRLALLHAVHGGRVNLKQLAKRLTGARTCRDAEADAMARKLRRMLREMFPDGRGDK